MNYLATKSAFKVSVALTVITFAMGSAVACSCKTFTPEEIATNEKYEFTKLKINYPTVDELWQRLKKWSAFQRPYSVTVLEDIKGKFNYSDLFVEVGDVEACGTSVSYGQTLYLIRSASGTNEWGNHASWTSHGARGNCQSNSTDCDERAKQGVFLISF